jgi:hypothetical protein
MTEVTGTESRVAVFRLLIDEKPPLIFFGNRLYYYFDELMFFLDKSSYINVGGGIFAKARIADGPQIKGGVDLDKLWAGVPEGERHIFIGPQFQDMHPVEDPAPLRQKIDANTVACTRFGPIRFPGDRTFAQVFDYDRNF